MTEAILPLSAALLTGIALGLVFFHGLWLTVNGLDRARRPALRLLASMLIRFGLTLLVFYLLARHGDWSQLLAAAIGFGGARLVMVHRRAPQDIRRGAKP